MFIFGAIIGGLSAIGAAICGGIGTICTAIAGSSLGSAISAAISGIVAAIEVSLPEIISGILAVASVVCKVAELLGLKKEGEDEADELAMKAEKSDMKPEDFDSTEEYIKHLHEEVQLTDEEKLRLEKMDDKERAAYRATGTYIYLKGVNEKLGLDDTGMKNPEVIGITVDILADLVKLNKVLSPDEFVVYTKHLQAAGLSMDDFAKYLHNTSGDVAIDKRVQAALADAMRELDPSISDDDIARKLTELNIED